MGTGQIKRAALLLLLCGCADSKVNLAPQKQTIFDVPGTDPSFADVRLVGFCVRNENGQPLGQIVGVTENGYAGRPGYQIAAAGATGVAQRTTIGTAGIRDRVISCP